MKILIRLLALFVIFGCGGEPHITYEYAEDSGRSIDSIYANMWLNYNNKYPEDIEGDIVEIISHDVCDCLTNIDLYKLEQIRDSLKKQMPISNETIKIIERDGARLDKCSELWTRGYYSGYRVNNDTIKSSAAYYKIEEKCPAIHKAWKTLFSN